MTRKRVVYTGCGISGKTTSLASVIEGGSAVGANVLMEREEYLIRRYFESVGREIEILASTSATHAWLYFKTPQEAAADPRVMPELKALSEASGYVYVIESQSQIFKGNLKYFTRLGRDLAYLGCDFTKKPIVFQVNKRDLPGICSMEQVRKTFHTERCAYIESVATKGIGTIEALESLMALIEEDR